MDLYEKCQKVINMVHKSSFVIGEGEEEEEEEEEQKEKTKKRTRVKKVVKNSKKRKKSNLFRSRNNFIDAALAEEGEEDNFADLEDWIVCKPGRNYN